MLSVRLLREPDQITVVANGVGWQDYLSWFGPAIGVLLIGFAEGLGAAKTYAAKAGYDVNANRELAGLGATRVTSARLGTRCGRLAMRQCLKSTQLSTMPYPRTSGVATKAPPSGGTLCERGHSCAAAACTAACTVG
ncbi:MAG TPA: SulP family inorganic anion transporter [Propionibacteriaceae bacterium]